MWMILIYFTPVAACAVLVVLVIFALILARQSINKGDLHRPPMRAVLGVVAVVYLTILAAPILNWDQVGEVSHHIEWNAFSSPEEIQKNNDMEAELSFGKFLGNGESAYYSPDELTAAERQSQLEVNPYDPYDYFVHDGQRASWSWWTPEVKRYRLKRDIW